MSRKLLDLGDARSAYQVVADAAEPTKENSRVERHFMAGWIALRFSMTRRRRRRTSPASRR